MDYFLYDKEFLKELDKAPLKEVYARITALNMNEEILESIEGHITSGSINVDGTSSVRRTCTLSLVAKELNIHEFYWGLRTKFKLEVGLKNTINDEYPEILWFKQGTFVISSFSTSQSTSSYTVSIQGKDKMTLLNGELGGTIYALTHNFGVEDYTDENGILTTSKLLIKDIVTDAVHEFAKEPLYNIIVNDLDDYGIELMEYRGKDPLYVIINENTQEPTNITLDGAQTYKYNGTSIQIQNIPVFNPLFDLEQENIVVKPTVVYNAQNIPFTVAKLTYGMTAGYRITGITYAGDLISNVGETITSMLDKLVSMLGEFEYFYDLEGRFIFQRRKTYISTAWNNIQNNMDETYVDSAAYTSAISYSFEDSVLITSFGNNPNIANLKNDYSIWGIRKSVTGKELDVHMRYAIDTKPTRYVNYDGNILYTTIQLDQESGKIKKLVDWREIIYQMALDFRRHNREDEYYVTMRKNNPDTCPNGMTGYEQYYTDMEGFWRQLYNPEYDSSFKQVFVTKNTYEANPSNYYYSVPKYTQSKSNENFHSNIVYYSYQPDDLAGTNILKKVENLIKSEYLKNPTEYYYINAEDEYEIKNCIIIEPYRDLDPYYYNSQYKKVGPISRTQYEAAPQNYYFINSITNEPCIIAEEYKNYYTYYKTGGAIATEEEAKTLLKSNPLSLYRIESEYKNCTSSNVYSSTETYYQKEKENVTDRDIYVKIKVTEKNFNANKSKYYTFVRNYNVVCGTIAPFDANKDYIINGQGPVKFTSTVAYETAIKNDPSAYYRQYEYLCCKHPIKYNTSIYFYEKVQDEYSSEGWVKEVYDSPELLNFWFDFLDEDSELQKYSCQNIGNRPKAVKDSNVKAIYFRETPTVIFVNEEDWEEQNNIKLGYTYIKLPPYMQNLFSISSQGKSAKNVLDEYLYNYACCAESISLSCLPIYYLQPNTRIFVRDDNSGINGEYIMTRYSLPLGHSGTMSISATKAVDRLY